SESPISWAVHTVAACVRSRSPGARSGPPPPGARERRPGGERGRPAPGRPRSLAPKVDGRPRAPPRPRRPDRWARRPGSVRAARPRPPRFATRADRAKPDAARAPTVRAAPPPPPRRGPPTRAPDRRETPPPRRAVRRRPGGAEGQRPLDRWTEEAPDGIAPRPQGPERAAPALDR